MYDISENKRRNKVQKLLESYGYRVNYSVFEITLSETKLNTILLKLKEIAKKEDNIRVYILNKDVIKKSFTLNGEEVFNEQELYF